MLDGLLSLLLLAPLQQEPKKAEGAAERLKRSAIVDRIRADPSGPKAMRPAQVAIPAPPVVMPQGGMRRMSLELKEVDPPKEGEQEPQVGMMGRGINLQEMALSSENFDRWTFEDGLNLEARRERLKGLLDGKIEAAREGRPLEADSERKLRVAGNGDIKLFLDRIEAARAEFEATRQDFNAGRKFLLQLEPLANEYQTGPFGPNSIFEKALRKIDSGRKSAAAGSK